MTHSTGLPGLRGVEHIGITVPDLDEAEHFFVNVIGCERIYSLGPFTSDSDWMETHLGVNPRTVMRELRFYRCHTGANFEVFQYDAADGQLPQPRNSDIGGHHVAFYVDDFDAALEHLKANDIEIMDEPTHSSSHSLGQTWVYFKAPWGMYFELVSYPDGKAYEASSPVTLWHPAHPTE